MIKIIECEYIINLVLLLYFYMHMFQLNSYFFKKQLHWMKENTLKVLIQIAIISIPVLILPLFKGIISNVFSIIFLAISIVYNLPKGKSKIPLKFTNRVKRMFFTEAIIIICIMLAFGYNKLIINKLAILNIFASCICIIANIINYPIELIIKKKYICDAKRILKDMPNLTVIGVTGSFGKTSVKNFLVKTLSAKYEVLTTPKNYNTTMGVVKTIRENLKPIHQIFVCEMGATKIGDIKEICDIVKPKIGIITSIGPQHLQSFKSIENVIKTKFELADSVEQNGGVTFLNFDNEYISKQKLDINYISYGINNKSLNYNAYNLSSSSKGLSFKLNNSGEEIEFRTKLIGKHNVENMTAAIAVSNYLDIPLKNIVPKIREIQSIEHRLQIIPHGNLTIIDNSYNSNPVSSKAALDTLSEFEGTKIIVTPGLIELGNDEKKYNFKFGEYITEVCDYVYLVGEKQSKAILEGINFKKFNNEKVFIVNTPNEAVQQISNLSITGNITVLLENDLPDNYNL